VVHRTNARRDADVAQLIEHRVEIVITSVGSPEPVLAPLQDAGCIVFADVASMRHVERALALGVDGLVLLSAGAGGQTGWLNPLAFIRAVRECYEGPVVLAGGIADGVALASAVAAGADLAYMGTRFIATVESAATDAYKNALVAAGPDEIELTSALTGLQANVVASSIPGSGAAEGPGEPAASDGPVAPGAPAGSGAPASPRPVAPGGFEQSMLFSYKDAWSAGHSVCGVREITDVATLINVTREEFLASRALIRPAV
jgi:nitronate monooxygenase